MGCCKVEMMECGNNGGGDDGGGGDGGRHDGMVEGRLMEGGDGGGWT